MTLPLKIPVAAVMLFGALFGSADDPPPSPRPAEVRWLEAEPVMVLTRTREKAEAWALRAWPVRIRNPNTNAAGDVRLYRDDGTLDEEAAGRAELIVNPEGQPLDRRALSLAIRAAYFFGASSIDVISGYRADSRGSSKHHAGEALDFKLDGVDTGLLAAHLRGLARVGVGVYTHPRTRYVHVDVREQSYHWVDASPPGKTWREQSISDLKADARDRAWAPEDDLPSFLALLPLK